MHDIVNASVSIARSFPFTERDHRLVESHASRYQSLVVSYGDAVRRGNLSKARRLAESAVRGSSGKVVSELRNYGGTRLQRPSLEELLARANSLRLPAALAEPVRSRMEPKLGGGWRPILSFGRRHKVLHSICVDLLRAALPKNDREYNRRQRGDDRMTVDMLNAMQADQLDHVVSIDVRNCFGSVRKEEVSNLLPLPRWMTEHIVLLSEHKTIVPSRRLEDAPLVADEAARAGLPQGASTSGLIVSRAIFGPLLAATSFPHSVYLYGDNLFVLASGRAEADVRLGTLRSLLANSPAGPLTIGAENIYGPSEKAPFLKYARQPIPDRFGGGHRIVPSPKSFRNFFDRAQIKMFGADADGALQALERYRENWLAAFSLYRLNDTTRQYMETHARMAYLMASVRENRCGS